MKYICKDAEPDTFHQWKIRNKGTNWDKFSGTSEHGELRNRLIEEQLRMCCYCEVLISEKDSHVEHLKPKGNQPKYTFSYKNLLASCDKKDCCGRKKGGWYEPDMVSPLDEKCGDRFTYALDGRILSDDDNDEWAKKTIEKLGLNCPGLKDRRKSIIKMLENNGTGPEPIYLKGIIESILEKKNEWTHGFYTLLLFLAETYDIPI